MPCSTRGSAMAVLEIEGDTTLVSPVRKQRRLGGLFVCAVGWIGLIALAAIFANLLPIASPTDMDLLGKRALPSAAHLLGNDQLGRDELSRLIYGGCGGRPSVSGGPPGGLPGGPAVRRVAGGVSP